MLSCPRIRGDGASDWFKGKGKAEQDAYLMDSLGNGSSSATAPTT